VFRIEPGPGTQEPGENLGGATSRLGPPSAADFLESRPWRKTLAIAHANRGAANSYRRNYDAAIADYTEAIRLHRTFAGAYVSRGNAYADKGNYPRAIADYTEAIRLQPQQVGERNAYGQRAKAYRAMGDEDNAVGDERRMSACHYSLRGEAHVGRNEVEQAIAAYGEAIRLDPTPGRYVARARCCVAKQDYDQAIADYGEAIRLDPQDATLYLMRAQMYRVKGDKTHAAEDERKMEELCT
jgi:tetratricopeptide (TPR) repeat protein